MSNEKNWYKEAVVYQIYPRSFQDSNGDGIGDLHGIIKRLDYLQMLGITVIWISPIYQSPLADNGYDISNYYDINPEFGTLEDFKTLVQEAHKRGIRIVMDLVINHTSNQYPWFLESKKSIHNPYRDYYIWRKGRGKSGKKKPNNWTGFFGGDVWEYDENTNEYYLHLFSKDQPDLNWENPLVRAEIKNMIRYWLDLGVDGFRCDVINILSKKEGLPNGRLHILRGNEHYVNGPKIHQYLQELKEDVFDHYDCFTVGETVFINPKSALTYLETGELSMLFHFEHMGVDNYFVKWFLRKFKPRRLLNILSKWQISLLGKGWNALYFENHDQPRSVSRFGNDQIFHKESAKFLATILYFQQGTPFIYQGQEIGMTNPNFNNLTDYQDVETHNIYQLGRKTLKLSHQRMMKKIKYMSRDNARTPMQWDKSSQAGFTEGTPWLKVNPNFPVINVEASINDPDSILSYYRKIIQLRKEHPVIVYGDYKEHKLKDKLLYCYERKYLNTRLLVLGNYRKEKTKLPLIPFFDLKNAILLLSNYQTNNDLLEPYEVRVYILTN